MSLCYNRWGACTCTKIKGHKKTCVCQHGIEFAWLSDRKTSKQLAEDTTYKEELEKEREKM